MNELLNKYLNSMSDPALNTVYRGLNTVHRGLNTVHRTVLNIQSLNSLNTGPRRTLNRYLNGARRSERTQSAERTNQQSAERTNQQPTTGRYCSWGRDGFATPNQSA